VRFSYWRKQKPPETQILVKQENKAKIQQHLVKKRRGKRRKPAELIALSEGGRNKKQETDEEKTWLVLHKESKQAQKMQHPEKLNQEAKDKTSPGQCDPDNNNSKIHRRIHNGVNNGEEKKGKEEFTKEKEERVCTTTAQSQKKEKDIASKFTIHEKKNPPHPKRKEKTQNQKKLKTKKYA
jgi:hypothetical protein